jgi:hypothetical protein
MPCHHEEYENSDFSDINSFLNGISAQSQFKLALHPDSFGALIITFTNTDKRSGNMHSAEGWAELLLPEIGDRTRGAAIKPNRAASWTGKVCSAAF